MSGFEAGVWVSALPFLLIAATVTWLLSLSLRNASIAESLWSLLLFAAGVIYALGADPRSPRFALVLWPLAIWAARLSFFLAVRNLGQGEDRRYRELRERYEPHFGFKSVFVVFWKQALLAWIVSLPLLGAFSSIAPLGILDYLGLLLWLIGFGIEALGDWQLARFKRNPANDAVLMGGVWRLTRHPNYFGEFCLWCGFTAMAFSVGAWWAVVGPAVLLVVLLRVSGGRET